MFLPSDRGEKLNRPWMAPAFVAVYSLSLSLLGIGNSLVLTRHEVLAAEPAREMLQGGPWIVSHFAGVPRLVKPPTMSWFIAGSMALFRRQDEIAARLPSALAGAGTAVMVTLLTARWCGPLVALIAGLMQGTMFYQLMQGSLAEADMPLCFAVAAAMTIFGIALVPGEGDGGLRGAAGCGASRLLALAFHAAAGLAFLLKGPIGLAFIFGGCLLYLVLERDRRGVRWLLDPAGIIVLVLMVTAWPVAAYLKHPSILGVWWQETAVRAADGLGQIQPFHFYFWNVPLLLLPWLPFALAALAPTAARGRGPLGTPMVRFLACWFIPGFVLLSLIASKHKHYAIPILPPLSIAAAVGLTRCLRHRGLSPVGRGILGLLVVVSCAIAAAVVAKVLPRAGTSIAGAIALGGVGALLVLGLGKRGGLSGGIAGVFATAWVVCAFVELRVLPHFTTHYGSFADLGRRAAAMVPPGETTYLLGLYESHVAFYLRLPLSRIDDLDHLSPGLPPAPFFAVCRAASLELLKPLGKLQLLDRSSTLLRGESEHDRLVFLRFSPTPIPQGGGEVGRQ